MLFLELKGNLLEAYCVPWLMALQQCAPRSVISVSLHLSISCPSLTGTLPITLGSLTWSKKIPLSQNP